MTLLVVDGIATGRLERGPLTRGFVRRSGLPFGFGEKASKVIKLRPKANWKKFNHLMGGDWYHWGDVSAHVAREQGLWHISISHPFRYPTWDEIYTAWYDLVPDAGIVEGAIILPRKNEYVNIHPNCFHVHQLRDSEMPVAIL